MKKTITLIFIFSSLVLILDSFDVSHALMMFYLVGIIPGTNISIDAARMLEFFALFTGFIFARIVNSTFRSLKPETPAVSNA